MVIRGVNIDSAGSAAELGAREVGVPIAHFREQVFTKKLYCHHGTTLIFKQQIHYKL